MYFLLSVVKRYRLAELFSGPYLELFVSVEKHHKVSTKNTENQYTKLVKFVK